jgi:RNA polymerase sigma factor (sigma-70 family)
VEASALTNTSSMSGLRGPSPLLRLQSDERLIAMTRRGQHAAFEVLFSRYQSRLLSFCRHMLGSREDAEDVLQEVFTAAFNAVLGDEREINVRPWLYRIARNRSLNHLRRASAIGVDSMDVHFSDHGQSTGDRVIKRESFRQLLADVQDLPETQRTALLLREIDALSYEQIAHAMETTVPSIKSLLVRARISLAEAAEARKLNCAEVRLELGEVAEGLSKLGAPARRHVRGCENCRFFKKQLKENNHALAAILPVGPLLLIKKLLLTKLGSTASAGSAHVAGGAGATVGAAASAGAVGGGASMAGGAFTVGAGALATKAVAGLAAAAIVTAGAVAADHTSRPVHHHRAPASRASAYVPTVDEPVVVQARPQPISSSTPPPLPLRDADAVTSRAAHHHAAAIALVHKKAAITPASTSPDATAAPVAVVTQPVATKPVAPKAPPVTQVTTESTELPPAATAQPSPPPAETPAVTTATPSETPPVSAPPATSTETATTPAPVSTSAPVSTTPSEPTAPAPVSSTTQATPVVETGGG